VADVARIATVGVSTRPICGVRDHASLLAQALEAAGVETSLHWLSRDAGTLLAGRAAFGAWTRGLADGIREAQAEAILLHYSVFSYSYRGIPFFVHPTLDALRETGLPVLTVMHELAFPWGNAGARGKLWAATQRLALIDVVLASAAVVVTTDFRAQWLQTRRWLPSRRVAIAPVFSNLPSSQPESADSGAPTVGVFGFALGDETISLVLDALAELARDGLDVQLLLLGAPGPSSAAAGAWLAAARPRGVEDRLRFSGRLSAQDLSNALSACTMLLYADPTGPVSRKGTLAGSLASGRPLVVVEGRRRWTELEEARATAVVARDSAQLAGRISALLADAGAREQLGARGRAFAEDAMGVERTAGVVMDLLQAVGGPHL
jgi:glycosyltransferase involved in cell wall biosynthesis